MDYINDREIMKSGLKYFKSLGNLLNFEIKIDLVINIKIIFWFFF